MENTRIRQRLERVVASIWWSYGWDDGPWEMLDDTPNTTKVRCWFTPQGKNEINFAIVSMRVAVSYEVSLISRLHRHTYNTRPPRAGHVGGGVNHQSSSLHRSASLPSTMRRL